MIPESRRERVTHTGLTPLTASLPISPPLRARPFAPSRAMPLVPASDGREVGVAAGYLYFQCSFLILSKWAEPSAYAERRTGLYIWRDRGELDRLYFSNYTDLCSSRADTAMLLHCSSARH